MIDVIERARRYIAKCAPAVSGQGGHDATFHVAAVLVHGFALPANDALLLLREFNGRCQPLWKERELWHKVASAMNAQHGMPRGHLLKQGTNGTDGTTRPAHLIRPAATFSPSDAEKGCRCGEGKQTPADPVAATERFLQGLRCDEADLFHASPLALDGGPRLDGARLVRALYAPGERINFVTEFAEHTEKYGEVKARPVGKGITLERDDMVSRFEQHGSDTSDAGGWLRMNPVDGQGIADANVMAGRFALLESDTLPMDLQLALVAKLPLPIAAIVSSGGRSLHAWVKLDARDLEEYRDAVPRLLGLLAKFGIDGKNKNPSRLSRLPGARRVIGAEGDGLQRLLYLHPDPEQRSIL